MAASTPGVAFGDDLPPGWGEEPPPPPSGGGWIPGGEQPPETEPVDWLDDVPAAPAPTTTPTPAPTPAVPSVQPSYIAPEASIATPPVVDDGPSSLSMSIVASPSSVVQSGGLVLFDVSITNTSAVDSVTIESLTDSKFGDISTSCLPALPVSVAPEGSILCSFRENIGGEPSSRHVNSVFALGTDDDGEFVSTRSAATVDVEAVVDLEVFVTASNRNVSVSENASWGVLVANRGPSEATGVLLKATLPDGAVLVSSDCLAYRFAEGRGATPCEFDSETGLSEVASIPSGGAFAMTLVMSVDEVGELEALFEIVAVDQADVDSLPADSRGDDYGGVPILMTVELAEAPLPAAVAPSGGGSGGGLPMWPIALWAVVIALALARGVARWRLPARAERVRWSARAAAISQEKATAAVGTRSIMEALGSSRDDRHVVVLSKPAPASSGARDDLEMTDSRRST
ncbi:MAG: DUF11 domain-containing protein [Acidimicrobiia bacterium]|nr:DUF11 domain-containing protein [Acidimicrobiia bacterium]